MLKNLESPAKVPGVIGFSFDIVFVIVNLKNVRVEENSRLRVDVIFNNNKIKVTSSRINVSEFKPGRSFEFNERVSVLKDKLLRNPLECQVHYENQYIGTSSFVWPVGFINCIADGCGRELTRCDETDIMNENIKVGRMEIIIRLQIKCQEYEEKQTLAPTVNFCKTDENILNSNDVMFVVGKTNEATSCSDVRVIPGSSSGSSANATCLDLSHFRPVHGKTLSSTEIFDSLNAQCCKRKETANQFKDIIKVLLDQAKERSTSSVPCTPKPKLCDQSKLKGCLSDTGVASCTSSDSCRSYYCLSDENASASKSMTSCREKPTERYCPFCNDDITWLPRFSACPKCGYKPISCNVEEKPYDDTLTADKILQEYRPESKQIKDICQQRSGCKCKEGKICAHCRVRKLCEGTLFMAHGGDGDCGKCETKSSDLYNICKTNSRDCRPYLAKVFQDLKELFDMNEAKKRNKEARNKLKSLKSTKVEETKTSQPVQEKNVNIHNKKVKQNNFRNQELCKSKVFDYNKRNEYSAFKIGHKTCLNGRKIVPRNMGWLWNAEEDRSRTGWIPGAIRKSITVLMQHFLNKNNSHHSGDCEIYKDCDTNDKEEKDYTKEPTLHICKKNGAYYITLRPLKTIRALKECTEPCANMQPIQFKITKSPGLQEMREMKGYLKDQGFAKCTCHQPISNCCCRSFLERKKLEFQCCKECNRREMPNCTDKLVLSDTSDSEAEFDFGVTPPAGSVQHVTCLKKRKKVSSGTQYAEGDWNVEKVYPNPLEKYFKLHNCSIGNRFGKAFDPFDIKDICPGPEPIKRLKGADLKGANKFRGPDGKFSMSLYMAYKDSIKPSKEEMAEIRRRKRELLKGANPPLLCKVERRGKPIDTCSCLPCVRDDRIC